MITTRRGKARQGHDQLRRNRRKDVLQQHQQGMPMEPASSTIFVIQSIMTHPCGFEGSSTPWLRNSEKTRGDAGVGDVWARSYRALTLPAHARKRAYGRCRTGSVSAT